MKKFLFVFVIGLSIIVGCDDSGQTKLSKKSDNSSEEKLPSYHERYITLRHNALELDPEKAGIVIENDSDLFAVMIEETNNEFTSSLVVTKNGNASLYSSNGGGILGGISDPETRVQAASLVSEASKIFANYERADAYPVPQEGHIRFYFITKQYVHTLEDETAVIMDRYPDLHNLRITARSVLEGLYKIKKEEQKPTS